MQWIVAFGAPSPVDACFILLPPLPRVLKIDFHYFFFCLCLSLWPAGAPLHCSSASSTPIEQSPSPPPSPPANESQRRLLGNGVAQPTPDSDSEEEFVPNSFLVKSGSASLGVAANGKCFSLLLTFNGLLLFFLLVGYARSRPLAACSGGVAWCMVGLVGRQGPGQFRGLRVGSVCLWPTKKTLSRDRCMKQEDYRKQETNTRQRQRLKLEGA